MGPKPSCFACNNGGQARGQPGQASIAAGAYCSFAIGADGELYGWGKNECLGEGFDICVCFVFCFCLHANLKCVVFPEEFFSFGKGFPCVVWRSREVFEEVCEGVRNRQQVETSRSE